MDALGQMLNTCNEFRGLHVLIYLGMLLEL